MSPGGRVWNGPKPTAPVQLVIQAGAMGRGGDEIMVRAEKRYGTAVKVVVVASVVAAIAATACAIILAVKK